jgi:hypothetical protein
VTVSQTHLSAFLAIFWSKYLFKLFSRFSKKVVSSVVLKISISFTVDYIQGLMWNYAWSNRISLRDCGQQQLQSVATLCLEWSAIILCEAPGVKVLFAYGCAFITLKVEWVQWLCCFYGCMLS